MHMTDWENNRLSSDAYIIIAKALYCTCNCITVNSIIGYHHFLLNTFQP